LVVNVYLFFNIISVIYLYSTKCCCAYIAEIIQPQPICRYDCKWWNYSDISIFRISYGVL